MLIVLMGGPNSGKSLSAARRLGALHLPGYFALIGAHRKNRKRLWRMDWQDALLDPAAFEISAGAYPPPGERRLIADLFGGATRREIKTADIEWAAFFFQRVRECWTATGRDIIAEGELFAKPLWLKALRPDRVDLFLNSPERGVVRTERRHGPHPSAEWSEGDYLKQQLSALETARRWLRREL